MQKETDSSRILLRPTPYALRPSANALGGGIVLIGVAAAFLPRTDGHTVIRLAADYLGGILNTIFLVLGAIALLIPAYRFFGLRGLWTEFKRAAALMLAETIIVHLVKLITGKLLGIWLRPSGGWQGFPSGHAAASVVMAYLLTGRYPRLAIVWYGFAALICWSRVESGAHFAYQVVAGALVGVLTIFPLSPRFPTAAQRHSPIKADENEKDEAKTPV